MGYHFSTGHANIVAYATSSRPVPPRLKLGELDEFLATLTGRFGSRPLVSSNPEWITKVENAAAESRDRLRQRSGPWSSDEQLAAATVEESLKGLRTLLADFNLFALTVGGSDSRPLCAFAENAAFSSGPHALFLVPDFPGGDLSILDPFPAIALLAERSSAVPGVLFWSRSGRAAFAPLPEAHEVYEDIRKVLDSPYAVDQVLDRRRSSAGGKKLLHLSDVHFGTDAAVDNEAYLLAQLQAISGTISRVIITGDLFNQPDRRQATAFRNFRYAVSRQRGDDCIVIPGNHDQKWLGNVRSDLGPLANLEWSNVVTDDQIRCVFLCFDSSKDADWAKGRITPQQMREVATMYETKRLANPAIADYLKIALIHHHPFTFETEKETIVARAFARVGLTDELLLRMDDADSFLQWCVRRNVKLILHGHKHVPRYVKKNIDLPDGRWGEVTAVGCGTSLGVGGKPMSYNTVHWDPAGRQWSVSFFADADGGGFEMQLLAVRGAD